MDAPNASKDARKSQISCDLCQRRKVRCDKGNPCSTCQRAGVKCEVSSRQRLPRGRNGGRRKGDLDLKARIAKLENLVSSLGGSKDSPKAVPPAGQKQMYQEPAVPPSDMSRYIGSQFWSALTTEVNGLREVLDESTDSDSETPEQSESTNSTPPSMAPQLFNFVLCGPDSFMMAPNSLEHPPRHVIELLHNSYFSNVDLVFKVLHRPSVADLMLRGKPYLGRKPDDPAVEALVFSVYYAAINTQNEQVCREMFGGEKLDLLNKYRFALEVYLARADFINSVKIEALQAFVIFLASVRLNDHSRWVWTLFALVVRMSEALGLHIHNPSSSLKPFDIEMRRRLWHQIWVLDVRSAIDRGTKPMLSGHSSNALPPANLNDTDLYRDMDTLPSSREGFTDMSFCIMGHVKKSFMSILFNDPQEGSATTSWAKKQELVAEYKKEMVDKYLRYCRPEVPFHWFALHVADVMNDTTTLITIRPMHAAPQEKAPHVDGPTVLRLSIELLEHHREIMTTPCTEPWRWFVWVQWHPLAVAAAELCLQTEGPLVERAWKVVDAAFQQYSEIVADTKTGMLWQPIQKLMKKAKQNRRTAQMAKLGLGNADQDTAMQPLPTTAANPPPRSPERGQTISAERNLNARMDTFAPLGVWGDGILGPGSIGPNGPLSSSNDRPGAPTPTTNWTPDGFLFDTADSNSYQEPDNLMDMSWMNWEGFLGDMNVSDLEIPDSAGAPLQYP